MHYPIALPEPISKNIFEKYYQIIEAARIELGSNEKVLRSLIFLENCILSLERSLQDIASDEKYDKKSQDNLVIKTTSLLNNLLPVIICAEKDQAYIDCLSYNFIPVLSTLEHYKDTKVNQSLRHISKFNPRLGILTAHPIQTKRVEALIASFNIPHSIELDTSEILKILYSEYKKGSALKTIDEVNAFLLEDKRHKDYYKSIVLTEYCSELFSRYIRDELEFKDKFNSLFEEDPAGIREYAKQFDYHEKIERLFEFNDQLENLVWNINIKVEDTKFNAAEIGYLLWSMSKALESIDDVEVELVEWGEGSKWFELKVSIKNLASKVDLMDVMKDVRRHLEAFYMKRPVDELNKLSAEGEKIQAETKKIEKEADNMMSTEDAQISHKLKLQKEFLELQAKEMEIEEQKADIRLKNIEALKGISELMKDGIIQNNSDIQIQINGMLFFQKKNTQFTLGDPSFLDVNEQKEAKNPDQEI